jgi:adenosylcobinamide-phosphate synthase
MRRDARHHRSPNAGWPEAAMAGALGISLSGPRVYEGEQVVEPWIGDGERFLGPADIRRALKVYRAACGVLWTLAAVGALIVALVTR